MSLQAIEKIWPKPSLDELRLNRHCPPLDGIRGLAVLLVLCYDCLKLSPAGDPLTLASRWIASAGWVGVDLFFVLSGFLITGVLLDTRGHRGYWKSFFLRRSVRIFPLYYATLLTIFCLVPLGLWLFSASSSAMAPFDEARKDQLWYWLYLQNWLFAWQQSWPTSLPIKHFWSLAIEEQFYLVWPVVVALLSRRQLGWACIVLSLFSISSRIALLMNGITPMVVFVMTMTRLDGLCTGALLAIALRSPVWRARLAGILPILAPVALAGVAVLNQFWPILRSETFAAYSFGHIIVSLCFALLIGAVQCVPEQHLLAKVFSQRMLIVLGKYSYAIYVFHKFVYIGVMKLDWSLLPERAQGWGQFAVTLLGSLFAAQVSWILLERPCLSLKKYFPRPDDVQSSSESPLIAAGKGAKEGRVPHLVR